MAKLDLHSRFRRSLPLLGLGFGSLFALAAGCGPELDSISNINTLRILGLKKSAPYARPGETVQLELLWEDAGAAKPRKVERFIGFWCVNPLGDLFSQCLAQPPNVAPQFVFDQDSFAITLTEDMVRQSATDPNLPPYGVAFVFYGVCAGHLMLNGQLPDLGSGGAGGSGDASPGLGAGGVTPTQFAAIPTCIDDDGNELGSADFVVAYSAIYAYQNLRNQNPIVTGFRVRGKDVAVDCIDDDCVGKTFAVADAGKCTPGVVCVDACKDDGAATCPEIPIQPIIDRKSAEKDEVAKVAYDNDIEEALWVSYFTDRGIPSDALRLVNDATTGWNESYATQLLAPKTKGPLRIWAVVRDNRGGIAWVRVPAYVQ